MADRPSSPTRLAIARMFGKTGIRISAAVLAVFAAVALYAPFLSSEVALVWWDERGLRLPVFSDLFNRRSYVQYYDFLFNLVALMLPLLAVGWFSFRRRWSTGRRLSWSMALIAVAFVACLVPVIPTTGGGHHAIWSYRPTVAETIVAKRERVMSADQRLFAVFPVIPHRHDATYRGAVLAKPGDVNETSGSRFVLGSDSSGHDVCARMIFGSRISLTIGLVATGLSLLIGTIIGALSGYLGGATDLILQRIVEIMMCFPTFILVLTIVAMTDRDIFIIMMVLGLTGWAGVARLVRGEFLSQAVRDYVLAAEAIGMPRWRIMFRHILPNALTPLIITATFGIAGAVTTESGLAFLGLGDPNAPSWGSLLNQGRENIDYTWLIYAPGMAVFLLVTCL
ncbi:MAG: ABC transporter permease, partial [Planctomycetes bacterium]|nr:ABC transporter permease [Planctomycetota bacterium]